MNRLISRECSLFPRLGLALMLFSLGDTAVAADWMLISDSKSATYEIDVDSIRVEGEFREVWAWVKYKQVKKNEAYSAKGLDRYDCNARTAETRFLATFSKDGSVITSDRTFSDIRPVIPGSRREQVMEYICAAAVQ